MEEPAEEDFVDETLNWRVQLRRDNGKLHYTYTDLFSGEQIRGAVPLAKADERVLRVVKHRFQQERLGISEKELREALLIVYPELGTAGVTLPYGPLPALKLAFFKTFRVRLSEEALVTRRGGEATGNGWKVFYLFGQDKWGGTVIECHASHGVTRPRLLRIDENGTIEWLVKGGDMWLKNWPEVMRKQHTDAKAPEPSCVVTNGTSATPSWRLLNFPVAGFDYHVGKTLIGTMQPGESLTLVAEPDNTYDRRAVRLEYRGEKIGYVPRKHNTVIAALLAQNAPLECNITAINPEPGAWNAVDAEIRQVQHVRQDEVVASETAFFRYDEGKR